MVEYLQGKRTIDRSRGCKIGHDITHAIARSSLVETDICARVVPKGVDKGGADFIVKTTRLKDVYL